jgi:hypothetical protein
MLNYIYQRLGVILDTLGTISRMLYRIDQRTQRIEVQQQEDHLILVEIRNEFPGPVASMTLTAGPVEEQP